MEQLTVHWKDFHEIWYCRILLESVHTGRVSWKSDMNNATLRRNLSTFMIISSWMLFRMRDISDKYSRAILPLFWCSINILQKPCHLSDVKKYVRAKQPTYENITLRMRSASLINKAGIQTNNPNVNSYYCLQQYEIFCSSTKLWRECTVGFLWQHWPLFNVDSFIYAISNKEVRYCCFSIAEMLSARTTI